MIKIDKNNRKVQVAVSGGMGSMGQLVTEFILNSEHYDLAGIYDPLNKSDNFKNFNSIEEIKADILFEFAPSDNVNLNLEKIDTSSLNLIVGSSGILETTLSQLQKNANDEGFICVIPNFSVGAALQKIFSKILNDTFPDVRIEERHHSGKQDAPSGTALEMAKIISSVKQNLSGASYCFNRKGTTGPRNKDEIGFSVIRGGDIVGEHSVIFAGTGEVIELSHKSSSRESYTKGALLASKFLSQNTPNLYSMFDVLGL